MSVDLGAIYLKVKADTGQAESDLKKLKNTASSLSSLGSSLTLGITAPIMALGAACLTTASDASEMESKFNTVFKNLASEADAWANSYADAIGRSNFEIKEAISNQADLYQGMGFTSREAFELSKQVTELAYDLASFNNANDAEAVKAMTNALMGETESAKALGVNLTDTVMETSEFTLATGKSWRELTLAEKAQVRYQEAVKQSQNAIGDAERTSGGFANQTKRLKGNLEELAVEIGSVLLPVATNLVTGLNGILDSVVKLAQENPKLVNTVVALAGALAIVPPVIWAVGKALALFAIAPALFGGVAVAAVVVGSTILGMSESSVIALDNVIIKVGDFFNGFVTKVNETAPQMLASGTEIINKLVEGFTTGFPILLSRVFTLVQIVVGTIMEVAPTLIGVGINLIINLVVGIANALPTLATQILNLSIDMLLWFVSNLPNWILAGIKLIGNLVEGLASAIPNVIRAIWDTATKMIEVLIKRMPEFLQKGKEAIIKLIEGIKSQLPNILENMGNLVMRTLETIAEKMPLFIQKGAEFVGKLIRGIAENTPEIIAKIAELILALIKKIIEMLPKFIEKGGEIVKKLVTGLINSIPKLLDAGKDIAIGILNGIKGMFSRFLDIGKDIVNNIKQGVLNAWGRFTGWLSGKIKSIPIIGNFFKTAPPPAEGNANNGIVPFSNFANVQKFGILDDLNNSMNFNKAFTKNRVREERNISRAGTDLIKENKINLNVNLNIKEFNNSTNQDIEEIAEELAFVINKKLAFR